MIKFSCNGSELKTILANQVHASGLCIFPVHQGWEIILPEFVKPVSSLLRESLCLFNGKSLPVFLPARAIMACVQENRTAELHLLKKKENPVKTPKGIPPEFIIITDEYKAEDALALRLKLKWDLPVLSFEMDKPRFLCGEFEDERLNYRLRNSDFKAYTERRELDFPVLHLGDRFEQREFADRFFQGLFCLAQTGETEFEISQICEAGLSYWHALDNGEKHRLAKQALEILNRSFNEFPTLRKYVRLAVSDKLITLQPPFPEDAQAKRGFLKLLKKILCFLQREAGEIKLDFSKNR